MHVTKSRTNQDTVTNRKGEFTMYKWVGTEIVRYWRMAEYKTWFEKRNRLLQEAGLRTWRVHSVEGRTHGLVFFESPELESRQEWEEYEEQMRAVTRGHTRAEGVVLAGSIEWFILTDL